MATFMVMLFILFFPVVAIFTQRMLAYNKEYDRLYNEFEILSAKRQKLYNKRYRLNLSHGTTTEYAKYRLKRDRIDKEIKECDKQLAAISEELNQL